MPEIRRIGPQDGYDLWSETYDRTPNPVVSMDARCTIGILSPGRERVLDAGCGTGRNFGPLLNAGSRLTGVDFSFGMLAVARRRFPQVPLAFANLQKELPFQSGLFDAVLCALVGEHLENLSRLFEEVKRILSDRGRFVFSVYHPQMAAAGIEANFEKSGIEFRLGAHRHTVAGYLEQFERAGFKDVRSFEFSGDEELIRGVPGAERYLGFPILLVVSATA